MLKKNLKKTWKKTLKLENYREFRRSRHFFCVFRAKTTILLRKKKFKKNYEPKLPNHPPWCSISAGWPVNGEPSTTFGTLELLFPISKRVCSYFVPKRIVLVTFRKALFLFGSRKHRSCFVPKRIVHFRHRCGLFSVGFVYIQYIT